LPAVASVHARILGCVSIFTVSTENLQCTSHLL